MIVGLTGGIASGKSTVSNYLRSKNYKIYDADIIAKEISEQKEVEKEILDKFGNSIIGEDLKIDRKKLKKIVFEDKKKLENLNKLIHPRVFKFYEEIKKGNREEIIIFDVPLLFESGIDVLCDITLLIHTDKNIRIERIMKRDGIDRELAEKIINSQMPDEEKIKKADIIIENNRDIESLIIEIERFCEKL